MNLESFENEIARLESQLQDAIAALRALKDIQATFQDMQPRYERLKKLTDEAAGLPDHYAKLFETARQQAEARLNQLETQLKQQGEEWKEVVVQHQQTHNQLQKNIDKSITNLLQQCENRQIEVDALSVRYQQDQAETRQWIKQSTAVLQQAITTLDKRVSLVHGDLREWVATTLNESDSKLQQRIKQRFLAALWMSILALGGVAGVVAFMLLNRQQ